MDVLTITLIAVGLAMDAFAVSIARGLSIENHKRKNALIIASFFGAFQMIMPVIGWFAGIELEDLIKGIDHWIAFGLLVLIGSKMIHDSAKKDTSQGESSLRLHALLTLSIATSIDALMVGLSLAFLQTDILTPIVVIGIVTFSLSYAGSLFGNILGNFFGNKIKAVGGIILIAIGIRILLEHLVI
jgi:manganese efflux pump family protein